MGEISQILKEYVKKIEEEVKTSKLILSIQH